MNVPRLRLLAAALLGTAFAVAEAVLGGVLSSVFVRLMVAAAMLFTAFGRSKGFTRKALIFLSVSAAFAGAVFNAGRFVGISVFFSGRAVLVLISVFTVSYIAFSTVFARSGRESVKLSSVTVLHNSRSISFNALRDTGNSLSDPMTGKRVLVIDAANVCLLFNGKAKEVLCGFDGVDPTAVTAKLTSLGFSFRLIPYRAVGTSLGMLPAFQPEKIIVDGKDRDDLLIAVSPNIVGDGGAYSALLSVA